MTARRRDAARHARALTAVVLAAALAACSSVADSAGTSASTVPTSSGRSIESAGPGVQPSFETGLPDAVVSFDVHEPAVGTTPRPDEVRRSDDGDLLVTTWGSTSCPRMPVAVTALDLVTVEVVTGSVRVDPTSGAAVVSETALCTADVGPTTSTIRLPTGAAGAGTLTVVVDGVPHTVA